MKVCPKCRHINEDTDRWCKACSYDMTGVRPQSLTGYKEKKKNKNLKTIIILLIVVAVIFAAGALIVTLTGSYSLPGWILERMTYGRASVGYMLLPDAPHLFFRAG